MGLRIIRSNLALVLVLSVTMMATFWVQWPRIRDPYQIEEDYRVLYWMHRFDDRGLFQDDPAVFTRIIEWDLGSWRLIMDGGSAGYSLLFQVANQFVPFLLFSKLLIFPLTLIAVAYAYGIGQGLWGRETAVALCLIFLVLALASSTSVSPTGGLQRSFIFPLLLSLIYYLINKRYRAVAVILIISGLVYPAAFVLGVTTTALTVVEWQFKSPRKFSVDWRGGVYLITAMIVTLLVLTPVVAHQVVRAQQPETATTSGEMFQLFRSSGDSHILSNPLYIGGGRGQLFTIFPFVGRGGLATQGLSIIHIAILATLALLTVLLRPRTIAETSAVLKRFFASIWICFGLAWLTILLTSAFPLYLPSRYTEASLFLVLLIFVVGHGQTTFQQALVYVQTRPQAITVIALFVSLGIALFISLIPVSQNTDKAVDPITFRILLVSLLVIMWLLLAYRQRRPVHSFGEGSTLRPISRRIFRASVVLALILGSLAYIAVFQHDFYRASNAERALFAYLEAQPSNIRLGGDPHTLSSIPLFAKRQVLYNCESPNLNSEVIQDSLAAYYASPEEKELVSAYCDKYDVDFFVVDSRALDRQSVADMYCSFSPFDKDIVSRLPTQSDFFFANPVASNVVFQEDHLRLVTCPN